MLPINSQFVKNAIKLAGGSAIGQSAVVLAIPIVARIYSPTEMGMLGVFMSFVSFASVGMCLRYDLAIATSKDQFEADQLLIASIIIAAPMSFFSSLVMLLMIDYGAPGFDLLPRWSAIAVAFLLYSTALFTALRFWYVRCNKFGEISRALAVQGVGRGVIPILMGIFTSSWIGLLGGEIFGRMLGLTRMLQGSWPNIESSVTKKNFKNYRETLIRHWRYPIVFLPSSLIDALSASLPVLIITSFYGANAAGQYFLAYRVASAPAGLINSGVADAFHERLAEAAYSKEIEIHQLIKNYALKMARFGLLVYIPIALASPIVFPLIFDKSWDDIGVLISLLAISSTTGVVVSPISRVLVLSRVPHIKLIPDFLKTVAPVVGIWFSHMNSLSFISAMFLFCILTMVAEMFYMGAIWFATDKRRLLI